MNKRFRKSQKVSFKAAWNMGSERTTGWVLSGPHRWNEGPAALQMSRAYYAITTKRGGKRASFFIYTTSLRSASK